MSRKPLPNRKRPPHYPIVDAGNRSNIILVTVCTHNRKRILADPNVHQLLLSTWEKADEWIIGRYMILPDHIHLFCSPIPYRDRGLTQWVGFWKAATARAWPNRSERPIWQKNFWDRQLRRGESYSVKWDYVVNNPVRHGYVDRAEDWPYAGEINILRWHD